MFPLNSLPLTRSIYAHKASGWLQYVRVVAAATLERTPKRPRSIYIFPPPTLHSTRCGSWRLTRDQAERPKLPSGIPPPNCSGRCLAPLSRGSAHLNLNANPSRAWRFVRQLTPEGGRSQGPTAPLEERAFIVRRTPTNWGPLPGDVRAHGRQRARAAARSRRRVS